MTDPQLDDAQAHAGESGRSFWSLFVLLAAAAAILVLLQARRPKAQGGAYVGLPLPPLEAGGWLNTAKPLTTEDLRGKVVLVDYWATWCAPCRAEIPNLIKFHREFGDRVQIVGLTQEEGPAVVQVKNLIDTRTGMDWPIGYGAGLAFEMMGVSGIPTYILYDRTGRSIWGGHSLDGLEEVVVAALAKK